MGQVETEGLVLRTYALSDADKIVVVLTRDEGLVRGVAKGARRLKSRFGSGLEPFSVVRISFFRKEERELVSIGDVELVRSFFSVASDPLFLEAFSYAAELLQSFAPPHDPNERLYNMARICLETAASDSASTTAVVIYFEIWLLKLAGFLPNWERCSQCGREIELTGTMVLEPDMSGVCADCKGRGERSNMDREVRGLFLKAQRCSPARFADFARHGGDEIAVLSVLLKRMIARILNREVGGLRTADRMSR